MFTFLLLVAVLRLRERNKPYGYSKRGHQPAVVVSERPLWPRRGYGVPERLRGGLRRAYAERAWGFPRRRSRPGPATDSPGATAEGGPSLHCSRPARGKTASNIALRSGPIASGPAGPGKPRL
jgi:hypothetical protein